MYGFLRKSKLQLVRPDQINLLLLGFSEPKNGPTDRNKNNKKINLMGVAIGHNLIIPVSSTPRALLCKQIFAKKFFAERNKTF